MSKESLETNNPALQDDGKEVIFMKLGERLRPQTVINPNGAEVPYSPNPLDTSTGKYGGGVTLKRVSPGEPTRKAPRWWSGGEGDACNP